jgi:hypothetical protein
MHVKQHKSWQDMIVHGRSLHNAVIVTAAEQLLLSPVSALTALLLVLLLHGLVAAVPAQSELTAAVLS